METRAPVRAIAWIALTLIVTAGCTTRPGASEDPLLAGFLDPPGRARPDAFWPWLNGHAEPARITEEMEAFKAAGFARLQIWDVLALQDPEQIVPTENFLEEGSVHTLRIARTHVDGVVEAPMGAHFTECPPDYGRDEAFQKEYAATARDPELWAQFRADWLELESHEAYRTKLDERRSQ